MKNTESTITHPTSQIKLYSSNAIGVATFLGGPLAAGYLIGENYKSLNQPKEGQQSLIIGIVAKDGNIDQLITKKAEELARKIVLRTNQNMKLEDQGIGEEKIAKSIVDLAFALKYELKKSLWD